MLFHFVQSWQHCVFTIAAAFIWREQSGNQVGSNKRKIWKKKKEAFSRKIVLGFYLRSIVYIEFVLVNKHYRRIVDVLFILNNAKVVKHVC